jgi:zinc D-Ala-D-Ala carboxypeptidase
VAVAVLAGWTPAHATSAVPTTRSVTAAWTTTATTPTAPSATTSAATSDTDADGAVVTGGGTATGRAKAPPGAQGEDSLGPAELARQITQAGALTDALTASNAAIAAATTKLERLSIQANTLLQEYAQARDAERAAREEANRNVVLYRELSTKLGQDRRTLGQWAYLTYAGGGSISDMGVMLDALAKSPDEASDTAGQLTYLSDQRSFAFEQFQDQTQLQRELAVKAVEASTRATESAVQAADAKKRLDVVVQEQKAQLDATRSLHAEQVAKAGPIAGLLLGSGDDIARDATRSLRKALIVPGVLADGSVKACSTNEKEYPNGHIPAAGLCPLYADPAQSLRPGAAAAFNAMSVAYEKDTGSPICVTDSYRSYEEQVSVKATRGKWAASPGTSEHGRGQAVDLCGGINSFGSPAHLWMKQNAPLYGWFHPSWAEPTGSLPEPWHWEYAG